MNFKIYRGSWVRGCRKNTYGETQLLNDKNNMCCLGQVAFQCGVPLEELRSKLDPYEVSTQVLKEIGLVQEGTYKPYVNSELSGVCITYNDDRGLTDKSREAAIKDNFANAGHKVVFKNGKAPWFGVNA